MTRNCLNVMRKLASMCKEAEGVQYNPAQHDLPRQWFTTRGYTDAEYNKYKGYGYTLDNVTREEEINDSIQMDRRFNQVPKTTTTTRTPNGYRTVTQGSGTFRRGRPTQQQQPIKRTPRPNNGDREIETFDWTFR